jgi:hypothetical protein
MTMTSSTNQLELPSPISGAFPVITREREYLRRVAEQEQRIEATSRRSSRGSRIVAP